MNKGFDASKWQGTIDWNQIAKDGVQFCILRSTYNSAILDSKYQEYINASRKAGLQRGVYHFFVPSTKDNAQKQLDFFLKMVVLDDLDLTVPAGAAPVALDVEQIAQGMSAAELVDLILIWLEGFEKRTGKKPMIYSYPWFIRTYLTDSRLAKYPLWIADYHKGDVQMPMGAWTSYFIRQTSDKGHLDGISGNVDLDEEVLELDKKDANEIIGILAEQWRQGVTKINMPDGSVQEIDQAEIHRLANMCRSLAGIPTQD